MCAQSDQGSFGAQPERRPYCAPEVARVDLHADEVLVVGCKTLKSGRSVNQRCLVAACSKLDKS